MLIFFFLFLFSVWDGVLFSISLNESELNGIAVAYIVFL